jgi:hypothetical protein
MRIARITKKEDGSFEIKDANSETIYLTGTVIKSRREAIDILRYEAMNYRDAFRGYLTPKGNVIKF